MSKIRQNLVFLMQPFEDAWHISLKAGIMCLNRFCIDEDAAFELSGVYYLKTPEKRFDEKFQSKQNATGRSFCCLQE